MTTHLRYRPDTPLGRKFPTITYGPYADATFAETVRQAMHNTEQLEIVEED